jgi:hypothetical protein
MAGNRLKMYHEREERFRAENEATQKKFEPFGYLFEAEFELAVESVLSAKDLTKPSKANNEEEERLEEGQIERFMEVYI